MKYAKPLIALSGILFVFSFSSTASAGSLIMGESLGASCYQEAKQGRSGRDAIAICDLAINDTIMRKPDQAATYVNRGIVRSSSGDLNGAISDYNKALQINPQMAEAFANRGTVFIRQANYTKALAELDRALSLQLEQPAVVYYNRAIVHERLGDITGAYKDYLKATELKPNWQQPRTELIRFSVQSN
ncbi:tetratricopeptide repeat protein [Oceanicaulis sp. AH-315-P02]|nr:tetratricopeptide repeat protein [Robiginitomaculum sp.]MBN4047696.1 tetratricopeptide repeat protein [Oceanicaulis sp. AH-315-P02]